MSPDKKKKQQMKKKNLSNDMGEKDILSIPIHIPSDPEIESKKGGSSKKFTEPDETPKFHPQTQEESKKGSNSILSIDDREIEVADHSGTCLLYTSPSPRDKRQSRMPSSA